MLVLSVTEMELQQHANVVLQQVVLGLSAEGYIDQSKCNEILENYAVVIINDSWIPNFLRKAFGVDGKKMTYKLVKYTNNIIGGIDNGRR